METLSSQILSLFHSVLQQKQRFALDSLFLSAILRSRRDVSVYQGKLDTVEIADEIKLGVLIQKDQRLGSATLERCQKDLLESAIHQAIEASTFNDPEPAYRLSSAAVETQPSKDFWTDRYPIPVLEKMALEMENKAKGFSPRIKNIPQVSCGHEKTTRVICHSGGLRVLEDNSRLHAGISVMACGEDDRMVNVHEFDNWNDPHQIEPLKIAEEVVQETLRRICPAKVSTGRWSILFDARTAAQILAAFWSVFSGDLLYRHLSRLEGKLGGIIASPLVSLLDSKSAGLTPHHFDAEGAHCKDKFLIQEGRFETFLHNLYTAQKTNFKTTGNAAGGLGQTPSLSPMNLSWEGRLIPVKEMIGSISKGILIKELAGSSASPISGDFSYGGLGYWIENGKISHPVADFTIAGNFFDFLLNIQGIGDDLLFTSPHLLGCYGGRSLWVEGLSISGQ